MNSEFKTSEQYYLYVYDRMLTLAPLTGAAAGLTFTVARIAGYFTDTSLLALIIFDIVCLSYIFTSRALRKYGVQVDGKLNRERLFRMQIILSGFIILQWNLISYIFPVRDFWGYAFLFVLLSAFLYDIRIVSITAAGIVISILASWVLGSGDLLPALDEDYIENLIMRFVGIGITFAVIFALTNFAGRFVRLSERNARSMKEQNEKLETMNRDIIAFTAELIERRDATSGEHVKRVKYLTQTLAEQVAKFYPEYGLTAERIDLISSASSLHDVGKICIPDSILLKPGKLTPEEFEVIKTHTVKGAEIIDSLPNSIESEFRKYCREICFSHHEKYDGKGYPCGLIGENIPISAQIVSVVDCYDALTTDRPYKKAIPGETALQMIQNGECGVFSEKILFSLLRCKDCLSTPGSGS